MIGTSFIDNIDTDICGDFFDHIDDLLDFPSEDIDIGGGAINGNCCNGGFQDVVSQPSPETVVGSNSVFSGNGSNGGTSELELPTELSVPYEDIAQLEWLSNFVEDSFSAGNITLDKDDLSDNNKDSHHFHISSPVSVLESSSSSSREKIRPVTPVTFVRGKPRSKRPRPASFKPRPVIPFISPTSSTSENWSEFDNFAEFFPSKQEVKLVTKEHKKKKKLSSPISSMEEEQAPSQKLIAIRKCMHCEITKTPQWRAGPMGPKTLCNACGVRYKSGRLFPEYRPAASPTFVTSLHSNSHKKVLEMRTKIVTPTAIIPTEEVLAEKQSSF